MARAFFDAIGLPEDLRNRDMHFLNRAQLDAPYDAAGRPNGRVQQGDRVDRNRADTGNHNDLGQDVPPELDGALHRYERRPFGDQIREAARNRGDILFNRAHQPRWGQAGPADFEAAAREHARRGQQPVEMANDDDDFGDDTTPTQSGLPFVLWTVALHHPLSAMVGLGFAAAFAAAFAATGGAIFGRQVGRRLFRDARPVGRRLFRDARPNQPVTTAQLEDTERRIAEEINRLGAIQQAALGPRARGALPNVPAPGADGERGPLPRASGLDRDRELDADARWFQQQMGEEDAAPDPPIRQAINNEIRENNLPEIRDRGRMNQEQTPPATPATDDLVYQEFLEQLLREAKEDVRVLRERGEEQSAEITRLRALLDAEKAENDASLNGQPTRPRASSIPSTNHVDTTGPVLAQIRPVKSVSPEEVPGPSTTTPGPATMEPGPAPTDSEPQARQAQEAPIRDAPDTAPSSRNEPEFTRDEIGSYIQDIQKQYHEYSNISAAQDDSSDPFMEELKHYDELSHDPSTGNRGKQDKETEHDVKKGDGKQDHSPFLQGIKDRYGEQTDDGINDTGTTASAVNDEATGRVTGRPGPTSESSGYTDRPDESGNEGQEEYVEVNEKTAALGDTRPLEAMSDRYLALFTIYDDEPVVHHTRWTEVMVNITYAQVPEGRSNGYAKYREMGDWFADVWIHGDVCYIKQYGRVYRCVREGDVFVVDRRMG